MVTARSQRIADACVMSAACDHRLEVYPGFLFGITRKHVVDFFGLEGLFGSYGYADKVVDKAEQTVRNAITRLVELGHLTKVRQPDGKLLRHEGQVVYVGRYSVFPEGFTATNR